MKNLRIFKGRNKALLLLPREKKLATFAALLCLMTMMPLTTRAQSQMSSTPLTFEAVEDGMITVMYDYWETPSGNINAIQYKRNDGSWTDVTWDEGIMVSANDVVSFRGDNSFCFDAENWEGMHFVCSNDCYVYGNVMSLLDSDGFASMTAIAEESTYCFSYLFCNDVFYPGNTTIKNHATKDLVLPATALSGYCYNEMFEGCQGLTKAPALPATTLAPYCYNDMFSGCTGLTAAPELPATDLTVGPALPDIPEQSGGYGCYTMMFHGCTSLTSAPALPATVLNESCYSQMFMGCTSLETAPVLPAPTLAAFCYDMMFYGCTSLNSVTCLATDISSEGCTNEWLAPIEDPMVSNGTFVKAADMTSWTTGISGIPAGWTVKEDMTTEPLTFEAVETGTINIINPNGLTIEYNKNNTGWTSSSADPISIAVAANDVVAFRGNNSCYWASGDSGETPTRFTATNPCYVYGNVMSLVHDNDFATNYTLNDSEALAYLFAAPTNEQYMFYGNNTTLQNHPNKDIVLPATTVPDDGYMYMFAGCQGLTRAPQLPATTIGMGSYHQMFADCIGLVTVPEELPATTLSMSCYDNMFFGCTSIEVAPSLPATTLANGCYMGMFTGCTSLTTAPALPATTLAEDCYHRMFEGCTSLTKAPDLPAATLFGQVYGGMFDGCTSLNYVKCLATNLGDNVGVYASVADWLNNVSPTGTFVKDPDMNGWLIGTNDGIPAGWTVKDDMYSVPLTFESLSNTLMINLYTTMSLYGLQYRTYNASNNTWSNWSTFSSGSTNNTCYVTGVGSKIQFKRENNAPLAIGYDAYSYFKNLYGNCYVYGNVMSLYNFESVLNDTYACFKLFDNNAGIRNHPTKDLVLGATTLTNCCYQYMFRGCTGLTRIPELPATTLANNCYYDMFRECTALNTKPVLPATTLAYNCYRGMFQGCTALTTPPDLPATTLAKSCYGAMFADCTNLQAAPELPATTLEEACYGSMFSGCTSLTTAPELPATTLATDCYNHMFDGCIGLTATPELPATTMAHKCYYYMFYGCTNLTSAPALPSTELATWCYNGMFYNCANLAEAPVLPATTLFEQCYADMFHGTSLATAPVLPATTLAKECYAYMFSQCSNLNYVKCLATDISADNCTLNWLADVSSTGTFVKAAGMEDWEIGQNADEQYYGIPEGWTVEAIDVFTTEGDWDVAANWSANAVPTDGSDVAIMANATVPNGCMANAGNVSLYGSTLTIADGGQLIHSNNVNATLQKNINAYSDQQGVNNGWYTIASPVVGDYSTEGLTVGTYDLYLYNEPTHYWWNAKGSTHPFTTLGNGQGYLYANSANQTLAFAGEMQATSATITVPLSYTATAGNLQGYNLVGNPFTRNLTAGDVKIGDANLTSYYYVSNGSDLSVTTIAERPIKPGEGFFVQTSAATNLVFNPATAKGGTYTKPAFIRIEVGNGHFMDYAYVQIGQGNTLRKMTLNDNTTRVCVMNDGMDYAAATIEAAEGEMPVNFKAAGNGTYTISVRTENLNLAYLHLIDNLTGADIDLLAEPSYTFTAQTTDYESRFKLVFSNGGHAAGDNASFAFINNGEIILTGVDGDATLQVIDVMGRVLVCRDGVHTVSTSGMTPGVYVLRLIQGDNVKTQKIVVR